MRKKRFLKLGTLGVVIITFALAAGFLISFILIRPALTYQADFSDESFEREVSSYLLKKPADKLPLSAEAYVVTDLSAGEKIVEKNQNTVLPIASVTKLMTALVAKEMLKPNQTVTITKDVWGTYGNTAHLRLGQKFPVSVALYPLLLSSSNKMAEALAQTTSRDKFIAQMNAKAKELGMTDTHYDDPSGLSAGNISTPADLVKLATYLYKNEPGILAITRERKYTYNRQTWTNENNVSLMKNYLGGKNGYTTEANRTLVSLFALPMTGSSSAPRIVALVLLQSDDKNRDTKNLINYLAKYVLYTGEAKNGFVPIRPDLPKT